MTSDKSPSLTNSSVLRRAFESCVNLGLEYGFIRTLNNIIVQREDEMSFSAMD